MLKSYNSDFQGLILKPNDSFSKEIDLFSLSHVEKNWESIPSIDYFEPGDYEIEAIYNGFGSTKIWHGELKSNILNIKIIPLPGNEKKIFSLYKGAFYKN